MPADAPEIARLLALPSAALPQRNSHRPEGATAQVLRCARRRRGKPAEILYTCACCGHPGGARGLQHGRAHNRTLSSFAAALRHGRTEPSVQKGQVT
ncbi:hypothetical protein AMYX_18180 [Anaeromyxobacter diazotrophicus]|uniref:Uncharacterized protein n=1 Tax=Anaeromyxobacter diazotrophicus TaxID=2590199 RepID=A0A7I9VM72_9BACT|nr:hypothetical protein AMYX_18180 [Anaeromyxobacter diazotrophicus]